MYIPRLLFKMIGHVADPSDQPAEHCSADTLELPVRTMIGSGHDIHVMAKIERSLIHLPV